MKENLTQLTGDPKIWVQQDNLIIEMWGKSHQCGGVIKCYNFLGHSDNYFDLLRDETYGFNDSG